MRWWVLNWWVQHAWQCPTMPHLGHGAFKAFLKCKVGNIRCFQWIIQLTKHVFTPGFYHHSIIYFFSGKDSFIQINYFYVFKKRMSAWRDTVDLCRNALRLIKKQEFIVPLIDVWKIPPASANDRIMRNRTNFPWKTGRFPIGSNRTK